MNGFPKLSLGFISSSSQCSCLSTPCQYFKVPNTLFYGELKVKPC
ncbi:hypothetical protein QFZ91_005061 [Paraburkholderia sp. JPY419]